jgi:hypothetical protein
MTTLQLLGLFLAHRLLTVVGCYLLLLDVIFWCVDWYKTRETQGACATIRGHGASQHRPSV